MGDADADGDVDGGDMLVWQRQLKPTPIASPASAGVPEPGALALVKMGAILLAIGRLSGDNRFGGNRRSIC